MSTVKIYCGPPIKKAGIKQNSIYKGELPKNLKEHTKQSTAVKNLVVEPRELAKTRRNIKRPGTREHRYYKQALEYVKGVE